MAGISLVINTLNEEVHIADCIKSAQGIADEIIICDMFSEDRTVEIAKEFGATVIFHEKVGFVEPARYFAISKASRKWVLVLDADERLTEKLANKLLELTITDKYDLIKFGSLYNYFGGYVKYGGFYHQNWPRFFKKSQYLKTYDEEEEMIHLNFNNLALNTKKNKLHFPKTILYITKHILQ